jgi:hypothetical protein
MQNAVDQLDLPDGAKLHGAIDDQFNPRIAAGNSRRNSTDASISRDPPQSVRRQRAAGSARDFERFLSHDQVTGAIARNRQRRPSAAGAG